MRSQVEWTHTREFAPGPRSASGARGFVRSHLEEHGLPQLVPGVQLVASELVTNALLHARTTILVTLEQLALCVRLTVHDDAATLPVSRISEVSDTGGRGLRLVEEYSAEWGFDVGTAGDKAVWATFALVPVGTR